MDGSITTNRGIALIGKLLAQKGALQITRVAVGDGILLHPRQRSTPSCMS